jgi:ATP-binding cassette subfamily F protein 3
MITAQEEPDAGTHTFGHKVATSFFSQNHADELDPTKTVLQTVEESATRENVPHARNLLGCFLFRGDDVFKKVGVLSGGERSRVALVRMLLQPANFLILDEPTNHLDMQSQDVLQRALIDYPGTVMIVSHNRYFLDRLVTKTLEFRPGESPRTFVGNITYYLEKTAEEAKAERAAGPKLSKLNSSKPVIKPIVAPTPTAAPASESGNRKDQRRIDADNRQKRAQVLKPLEDELASLEKKIAELEAAQVTLTAHLSEPSVAADPDKFRQATQAVANVTQGLENAYSRWGDLSAEIEALNAKLG